MHDSDGDGDGDAAGGGSGDGSDADHAADGDARSDDDRTAERLPVRTRSDRRRRGVRQLLFVIAGSHTGAFLGSSLPTNFGLPGNVSGVLIVVFLFVLPFAVDARWERIEAAAERIGL